MIYKAKTLNEIRIDIKSEEDQRLRPGGTPILRWGRRRISKENWEGTTSEVGRILRVLYPRSQMIKVCHRGRNDRSFLYSSLLWPLLWLTACFSPVSRPLQEKPDLLWLFQACTSVYYHIFSESKVLSVVRLVSSEVPQKKEKLLLIEPLNLDYKMCPNSQMLKCG